MRPPPLTSTLFPYTTLFRSSVLSSNLAGFELQRLKPGAIRLIVILKGLANGSPLLAPIHSNHHSFILHKDRKSTRLNSSHTVISYAVFCLKKKTQKNMYSRH